MKRTTFVSLIVILVVISLLGINRPCRADDVSLGRQAEKAGKFRQALTHYVEALKANDTNQKLREKIIKLAQKIQPPPAIPKETIKYMARGEAAMEVAQSESDFKEAVKEFRKALNLAPWWADAYFNRAIAEEKAGLYSKAVQGLKLYILAAPNSPDITAVETKIYKLEFKAEKMSRPAERLTGKWIGQREGTYLKTGPYDKRDYGKDTFRFEGIGKKIKVVLVSTQKGYNTSLLGNYKESPIGKVIFNLNVDIPNIKGVYFQPAFNRCNRGRAIPVKGKLIEDGNSMVLYFNRLVSLDDYANDGTLRGCDKQPLSNPVKLIMKKVQ